MGCEFASLFANLAEVILLNIFQLFAKNSDEDFLANTIMREFKNRRRKSMSLPELRLKYR